MAAIGSTVGGGMAAGAVITAAAPVAISAAVIYGLVKIFKD
ncbi:putative membrane protein [Escherichia coli PA14]|nr:putative membrane protein [Escherichia coli PA14]EIO23425.1 putative membrane protein [Escherichia coli PA31]